MKLHACVKLHIDTYERIIRYAVQCDEMQSSLMLWSVWLLLWSLLVMPIMLFVTRPFHCCIANPQTQRTSTRVSNSSNNPIFSSKVDYFKIGLRMFFCFLFHVKPICSTSTEIEWNCTRVLADNCCCLKMEHILHGTVNYEICARVLVTKLLLLLLSLEIYSSYCNT